MQCSFVGHVLLDLCFPSCAEIFLNGLPSRLATQCSSVSATEKILGVLSLRYSRKGAVLEVRGASGLPLGVVQAGGLCALGGWTAPRVQRRVPSAGTGHPCLSFRRLPFRRSASGLARSTLHHSSAAWRPPLVSSRTFLRVLFAECFSVPGKGPACSSGSSLPVGLHLLAPAAGRTRAPDSFSSCLFSALYPHGSAPSCPRRFASWGFGYWVPSCA